MTEMQFTFRGVPGRDGRDGLVGPQGPPGPAGTFGPQGGEWPVVPPQKNKQLQPYGQTTSSIDRAMALKSVPRSPHHSLHLNFKLILLMSTKISTVASRSVAHTCMHTTEGGSTRSLAC